jgi:hypothetical protein
MKAAYMLEMITILTVAGGVQIRPQVQLVVDVCYPNSLKILG